ncbi:MAG: Caib/baif family protein [Candidatus Nomurabacteria bacterium GW2011_GWA2_43_15]|uniref:Caib/baif family protein n=2 Tax=Candidatus Nomuraibacteriota TaxID=1752729 RepID=A0A0G1DTH5_9BACT|nr:MAG: Caib/baif family protein [Candidatus Nomurabacteria bacterium GW2011_GWA2_43_15]KKT19040.1 MAG: Caib/baif family protein [Candidatus Nomurabacteria bacterium GW2011_GWB1_43_7]
MGTTEKEFKNLVLGCEHCGENFTISEGELSLYEKVGIELPVLCFFCRIKLHLSFWMFGKFRKGTSDLSGESLITVLPEKNRYPIYTLHEWHSDAWDPINYGQDYDEKRPFFEQLQELQEKVPHPHQNGAKNTNCDWCDDVWNSKNCYLSRSMEECEDLYYSYRNLSVKNSIDVTICFNSEKCFDSSECHNSFKLFYSRHSRDCIDSYFLYDCRNCQNCFMCWNLRNQSYCIENVKYTKEEYLKKLESFNLGSFSSIQALKGRFENIAKNDAVHRQNFNFRVHDSDGDYLEDCKNCHNCHTINRSEDTYNCVRGLNHKSEIDANGCWYSELMGNVSCCVDSFSLKYSAWSSARYSEYLDLCKECEYCFGCVGLKKKKYCVLNKQYKKEEYEKLTEKIIADMKKRGEYGKFLPYSMSAGPFNFSSSFLYFPETKKEDILKLGGYWEDIDESHIEGMPTSELPDDIKDVPDTIITQALICPETGWRFNIAQNELIFYKANNIPLPRHHFDVRTKKQLKYLTVLKSYPYKCYYCKKSVDAFYPPEWGYQKIACEECYKQNIA